MLLSIRPEEMQKLERDWMRGSGVPSALLMEHAAMAVCDALAELVPAGARVLFLCGPGSNGGDGYAAARIWKRRGGRSVILSIAAQPSGDAGMNARLAALAGIPTLSSGQAGDALREADAVCDALFGTGLSRDVTGEVADLIAQVNESGLPVCAVDIPSGLDGTDGQVRGIAVQAAVTVTFHRPKQGLLIGQSADFTGRIVTAPILIPEGWSNIPGLRVLLPGDLTSLLKPRRPSCHKGSNGRAVILAGSLGMAGAAALCASACIRGGAGLTTILARASIVPILQTLVPGATCTALPERDGCLTEEAAGLAERALASADAAAIGPGLGQGEDLLPLLTVFRRAKCPVVWDADALNLLSGHRELLPLPEKDAVTPHPGEASRLLGQPAATGPHTLRQLRAVTGCRVLLKGARTLMSAGAEEAVNITGTPAMAKGGSGDVLTGLLTAVMAQRLTDDPLTELQLAALLHGMAGLRAEKLCGQRSLTPQELCGCIRAEADA